MSIKVRDATIKDAEKIASIHVDAWRKAYAKYMPKSFLNALDKQQKTLEWERYLSGKDNGSYIVCKLNSSVEGFAVYGRARDTNLSNHNVAELVALNVHPDKWGLGLGSSMLEHVIKDSISKSRDAIYLWVITSNTRAIELYCRNGFIKQNNVREDSRLTGTPLHESRYIKKLV